MKQFLLYLHQLPQNVFGKLVVIFSKAEYDGRFKVYFTRCNFGVSLGKYIILTSYCNYIDIKHEEGHQKQSLYLGWLYLPLIGLPSLLGNIFDRVFHRKWDDARRSKWYYSQPWEAQADRFGGVVR